MDLTQNERRSISENYAMTILRVVQILFDGTVVKKFNVNELDEGKKGFIIRITIYFTIYLAYRSMLQISKDLAEQTVGLLFNHMELLLLKANHARIAEGEQFKNISKFEYKQEEWNQLREMFDKCSVMVPPSETSDDEWPKLYMNSVIGCYAFYIADTCGIQKDDYISWVKNDKDLMTSFWFRVSAAAAAIEDGSMNYLKALNGHK